jgi:hypothetical protein
METLVGARHAGLYRGAPLMAVLRDSGVAEVTRGRDFRRTQTAQDRRTPPPGVLGLPPRPQREAPRGPR